MAVTLDPLFACSALIARTVDFFYSLLILNSLLHLWNKCHVEKQDVSQVEWMPLACPFRSDHGPMKERVGRN